MELLHERDIRDQPLTISRQRERNRESPPLNRPSQSLGVRFEQMLADVRTNKARRAGDQKPVNSCDEFSREAHLRRVFLNRPPS